MSRVEKEKEIVELMIRLYCEKKHKCKYELCDDCRELLEYAHKRLSFCKFGEIIQRQNRRHRGTPSFDSPQCR